MKKVNFKSGAGKIMIVVLLISAAVLVAPGCKKPDLPKALISVIDTSGTGVEGAKVKVFSSPNGSIVSQEKLTDGAGLAEFEFEKECILNVEAEKKVGIHILKGKGLVILKSDERYDEQVLIE